MTNVKVYQNKRNSNKFLEIRNDGHRHNSVRQIMVYDNDVIYYTGDGCLHRWRKKPLLILLEDYNEVATI